MNPFPKKRNCALCTHKHELFKLLSSDELMKVNAARIEITYKAGETIVKSATPITHFITFNKGLVKICIEGKEREVILQYLKPPDFYLGAGIFTDKRNHYTLTSIEDTSACLIDLDVFLPILASNNEFMYEYLKYQSIKELLRSERLLLITQKQMHGKIAHALLYLKNDIFTNETLINISKSDLANFTCMTKDSVGRILKEFQEGGIIELKGKTINVIDENILMQIGEYG